MKRNNKEFISADLLHQATRLGRAVSAARIARNMTRQDFSERANISASTLVRIENGDVAVSFSSWLQAFERAGILGLLQPLASPQNDLIGEARRKNESRARPRRAVSKTGDYDF